MWDVYTLHRHLLILGYYPSSLRSFAGFLIVVIACSQAGFDTTFGLCQCFQDYTGNGQVGFTVSCIAAGVGIWVVSCYARKLILKRALLYRGWLYEGKKVSQTTKLVLGLIRLLNGWSKPLTKELYGLQGIIPALPVPSLEDSVERYLTSVRCLVSERDLERLKGLAGEFVNGIGPKLQRVLVLKSWIYPNYISDWWEKYIYLSQRSSLLISSNIYSVGSYENPSRQQAGKAAFVAQYALKFSRQIKDGTLQPILGQDMIPLCTWQYERMFNTCRIPGDQVDSVVHEHISDYFAVHCKGRFYKLKMYHDDNMKSLLSLPELQLQFRRILKDASDPSVVVGSEGKLAALTTWNRSDWASARRKYFSAGINKRSLDTIEKSMAMIFLDDEEYELEFNNKEEGCKFEHYSRALLHGNGQNRWLDKSISFVIGANGRTGVHCEHSWGDAPVAGHLWESTLSSCLTFNGFDEQGNIVGDVKTEPAFPERLQWELSEECLEDIETAYASAQKLIANLDLKVLSFFEFGKGAMKKFGISPDACMQMALQLGYYRNQGKFDLTYEASMTRLYLQGRTETVRVCTDESCRWVLSMESQTPKEQQIKYFKEACNKHQDNYREAMSGKGLDRHLFGLYAVGKYLQHDIPFLEEALRMPWRLSTSQTSASQTKLKPPLIPGGGFGPVAEDGYGVSYMFTGEDKLFFHITSNRSCTTTDSFQFAKEIQRALMDISHMFEL